MQDENKKLQESKSSEEADSLIKQVRGCEGKRGF